MLFGDIDQSPGRQQTAGFIDHVQVIVLSVVCRPEIGAPLAQPQFDQIATAIFFNDVIGVLPTDRDLVPIPRGDDTFRQAHKCGFRQLGFDHIGIHNVADDLEERGCRPAMPVEIVGLHPKPGAIFIATVHLNGIALVEFVGVKIGLPRPIAAEPQGDDDLSVWNIRRRGGC